MTPDRTPDARRLALVRGVVFGLLGAKAALEGTPELGRLPTELLAPVLPLSLLPDGARDAILSPAGIVALRVVTALLCLAAALGRLRGKALLSPLLPLWLDRAFLSSFGYVGHAESALLLGAAALAGFAAVGSDSPRRAETAVLLMLTLGYALTGLHRVAHGTPDVFDADVLRWWAARNATWDCWETDLPFACGEAFANSPHLPRLLAWGFPLITLLEIASPLVLLSRRFALGWLAGIAAFHLLSLVCLSIFFWENLVLAGLLVARQSAGGSQSDAGVPSTSPGPAGAAPRGAGRRTSKRSSR
ncbi:MAG: hypothetical protein ACF8XB_24050 [Planctomycetota bacterium JB042]